MMQQFGKELVILLVDDDPEQRDYLALKFMQVCHCRVLNAKDPDEALALIEKYGADVLITDFLMPDGDGTGVDLIKRVSERPAKPSVLVLTTGFPDFLPDQTFNEIATIFCKPFAADKLINLVLEKLGMCRQQQAA